MVYKVKLEESEVGGIIKDAGLTIEEFKKSL
jgi:hypothetical protein